VPQIIEGMRHVEFGSMAQIKGRILPNFATIRRYLPTITRSGVIGTGVGALPGVGEDVAGWVSYGVGKSVSREGHRFGKGSLDGLLSSETANNACIAGALIPLLVLGIPGSPPAAALMGAFKINNVIPGPTIDPAIILRVVAIMVMASLTMFIMGLFTARVFIRILRLPRVVFLPIVMVLTTIGSFSVGGGINDLYLMLGVGAVAYFMNLLKFPIAPLVIGVILGGLFDETFRRSLLISGGDLTVFLSRPVAATLVMLNIALILSQLPAARRVLARIKQRVA